MHGTAARVGKYHHGGTCGDLTCEQGASEALVPDMGCGGVSGGQLGATWDTAKSLSVAASNLSG